ncbi:cupin domain-containing protein [bacterium]|nr:cupin domain-containing protein [bacterium]
MIKKAFEQETELRKNMRGGQGEITIKHHFKKDEINASCRLCAQLKIPPGAGIGLHEHNDEDEIFIIQQGKGIIVDNGKETEVGVGDAILTGKGAEHSIKNIGQDELLVTAVIIKYN